LLPAFRKTNAHKKSNDQGYYMNSSATYQVVSLGAYLDGFSPEQVQREFARLFKLSEATAATVLSGERTLKKGLAADKAELYLQRLNAIGVHAQLQSDEVDGEMAKDGGVEAEKPETDMKAVPPLMEADNGSEESESAIEASDDLADAPVTEALGGDLSTKFELFPVIAALIVASASALIWFFLSVAFKHEWAWGAWIVGVLIGGAAYSLKARSVLTAGICAALVIVAVLTGKFLTAQNWQQHIIDRMSAAFQTPQLREVYNRELESARRFDSEVTDTESLRQFIVNYGYSSAMTVDQLSEKDIRKFETDTRPRLAMMAKGELPFERWGLVSFGRPDEKVSVWSLMNNALGWLDWLFIVAGAMSAFGVVSIHRVMLRIRSFW